MTKNTKTKKKKQKRQMSVFEKNGQIWSKNDCLSVVIFWEFAELAWGLRLYMGP